MVPKSNQREKALVIDSTFYHNFGHNKELLMYTILQLKGENREIHLALPRFSSKEFTEEICISSLPNVYGSMFGVNSLSNLGQICDISAIPKVKSLLDRLTFRVHLFLLSRRIAIILKKNDFRTIILPTTDFASQEAILDLCIAKKISTKVNIKFRGINFFEHAHFGTVENPIKHFIVKLKRANHLGYNVSYTTESLSHSKYIYEMTGYEPEVIPQPISKSYILNSNPTKESHDRVFVLGFLGVGRKDKGSEFIEEMITHVAECVKDLKFIVQSPINKSLEYLMTVFKSVEVFDSPLTSEKYKTLLSECSHVILPYDPVIYEYRSTGIGVEAICNGKILFVQTGTAFAKDFKNLPIVFEIDRKNPHTICQALRESNLIDMKIIQMTSATLIEGNNNIYKNWALTC